METIGKADARRRAIERGDSERLFNACWQQLVRFSQQGAINWPATVEELDGWLDSIAAEKVNNPRSKFYIYG